MKAATVLLSNESVCSSCGILVVERIRAQMKPRRLRIGNHRPSSFSPGSHQCRDCLYLKNKQNVVSLRRQARISSHYAIALAGIDLPFLRSHVQIDGTNELEEWVVIRLWVTFFQPLVPPDQQTHEDLNLLQREVEADAHPLARGEPVSHF